MEKFLSNHRYKFLINSLLFFLAIIQSFIFIGLSNLRIDNFDWLLQGDIAADVINWLKFKNSDWFFPIGLFENSELGKSSIAYTGAVPFLSILLKFFSRKLKIFNILVYGYFYAFIFRYYLLI